MYQGQLLISNFRLTQEVSYTADSFYKNVYNNTWRELCDQIGVITKQSE